MKTKSISRFYNDQDGIKIYENIILKIKPFFMEEELMIFTLSITILAVKVKFCLFLLMEM